jgi:hypothetical protein
MADFIKSTMDAIFAQSWTYKDEITAIVNNASLSDDQKRDGILNYYNNNIVTWENS